MPKELAIAVIIIVLICSGLYLTDFIGSVKENIEMQTGELEDREIDQEQLEETTKKCPSSCDDNNPCTADYCHVNTDYECGHSPIIGCNDNDGCCPTNCNYNYDNDCSEVQECSDGTLYEECSSAVPKYCNNGQLIKSCEICGQLCPDKCFNNFCSTGECEIDSDCDDNKINTIDSCNWDHTSTYNTKCFHQLQATDTIKVLTIEFVYTNDPKIDYYYKFYCNQQECIFKSPEGDEQYYIDRCGNNCNIEQKTFVEIINEPSGITNIYPIGSSEATYSYDSIYKIEDFYESESQKYGTNLNINLNVKGPYILSEKPPQRLRDEPATEMEIFFDNEAQKNGVDISNYDVINYVYLTSENYMVSTISDRKTFNQMSISLTDTTIILGIKTIIHEMGHVFGARDKYSGYSCEYPDGFFEPDKNPLYPQSKMCLMCGSIMLEEGYSRGAEEFDEIVVCQATAEEIGWD